MNDLIHDTKYRQAYSLYLDGKSHNEIAKAVGTNKQVVDKWVKDDGWAECKKQDRQELIQTVNETADFLRSRYKINTLLKQMNISDKLSDKIQEVMDSMQGDLTPDDLQKLAGAFSKAAQIQQRLTDLDVPDANKQQPLIQLNLAPK